MGRGRAAIPIPRAGMSDSAQASRRTVRVPDLGWTLPDRLPSNAECTVRPLLERWANETPDKVFALFEDGAIWTYAETLRDVRAAAQALTALGVAPGDPVLNWLDNGADQLRLWLATNFIGAIHVPIATSARSGELQHILANTKARFLTTQADLLAQNADLDLSGLTSVILHDAAPGDLPRNVIRRDDFLKLNAPLPAGAPQLSDIALIIYTSGTTGAPKGVRNPYAQFWMLAKTQAGYIGPDDRVLISTSLSHISTVSMVWAALYANASLAIYQSFSVSAFWERVRRTGSTAVPGVGPAIMGMLLKPAPSANDRDNPLKIINVRAPNDIVRAFAERFGVDYFGAFGMTEASCIALTDRNSSHDGACGYPRPGLEVRLVDSNDVDVADGENGEIIIRADLPITLSQGYHDNEEATMETWRNGWFHTGDLAHRDATGQLHFHDRIKDSIRRRGENIASHEVEREAMAFPAVQYAAAMGVAGEFDDQEVLLVVEPVPGESVDPGALTDFIATRLSHFKVPRYVSVQHTLPKTTFGKIRKFEVLAALDLASCWDRERDHSASSKTGRK
jgi:crotonobetaine/carnitine-CoA ligase